MVFSACPSARARAAFARLCSYVAEMRSLSACSTVCCDCTTSTVSATPALNRSCDWVRVSRANPTLFCARATWSAAAALTAPPLRAPILGAPWRNDGLRLLDVGLDPGALPDREVHASGQSER